MFTSVGPRWVRPGILLLLFSTILACGNRAPLVAGHPAGTDYTETVLPQFSKPIPPEVLGGTGIVTHPFLRPEIARCCHEFRGHRIGGRAIPHTGCDCNFHIEDTP